MLQRAVFPEGGALALRVEVREVALVAPLWQEMLPMHRLCQCRFPGRRVLNVLRGGRWQREQQQNK